MPNPSRKILSQQYTCFLANASRSSISIRVNKLTASHLNCSAKAPQEFSGVSDRGRTSALLLCTFCLDAKSTNLPAGRQEKSRPKDASAHMPTHRPAFGPGQRAEAWSTSPLFVYNWYRHQFKPSCLLIYAFRPKIIR